MRFLLPILLLSSAIAFGLGISLPLLEFEKLYFFSETPSLIGIVAGLWTDGSVLLSLAVLLFSVVFPVVKMATVFVAAFHPDGGKAPKWAGALAKWSMMDVLLVALVIFAAKSSGLAAAIAQPGLWFYAASALTSAFSSSLLKSSSSISASAASSLASREG